MVKSCPLEAGCDATNAKPSVTRATMVNNGISIDCRCPPLSGSNHSFGCVVIAPAAASQHVLNIVVRNITRPCVGAATASLLPRVFGSGTPLSPCRTAHDGPHMQAFGLDDDSAQRSGLVTRARRHNLRRSILAVTPLTYQLKLRYPVSCVRCSCRGHNGSIFRRWECCC